MVLWGDAGQHQKQTQFPQLVVTQRRANAQRLRHPLQDEQEAENGSELRSRSQVGGLVGLATEQAAEGLDAGRWLVGELDKGAVPDFTVLAERLTKEGCRRGVEVGNGGDIHDFSAGLAAVL